MLKWFISVCLLSLPACVLAESPATINIQNTRITLYQDATFSSAIITNAKRMGRVREINRKDNWIQIQELKGEGRIGWVYGPTLGRLNSITSNEESEFFANFKKVVEDLNLKLKNALGMVFFTKAQDLGDGAVQMTATRSWLSTPISYRRSNLKTIYSKWDNSIIANKPLVIHIVDNRGQIRMTQQM